MHLAQIKNIFQHEEDEVNLNYWSACMIKFNNELLHRQVDDLRCRQNETMNDLQLLCKPLKSNFKKLFLILGKIFCYF